MVLVLCVGKTRARDAALNAIQSPLLDIGIERATGIVWNITGGSDLTLFEVSLSLSLSLSLSSSEAIDKFKSMNSLQLGIKPLTLLFMFSVGGFHLES